MSLYNTFAVMIEQMPAAVIPKALDLERRMLEADLEQKRTLPMEEVDSILAFCRFVEVARRTGKFMPRVLPPDHVTFYRKTTARLINAKQLPAVVAEQFEAAFSKRPLKLKAA